MPKFVAPDVDLWEFTCPFCETLVRQHWRKLRLDQVTDPPTLIENMKRCSCGACDQVSWWIDGTMVWPRASIGSAAHEDTPEDVRALYNEARSVADVSPRSAAALLRTALEVLVQKHLGQTGNLNDAIGNLVRAGKIAEDIQQTMDILRLSGNSAVHPSELQADDTTADAAALFELLNLCVDGLVAQPRRIRAIYEQLPEPKRQAIEGRDHP